MIGFEIGCDGTQTTFHESVWKGSGCTDLDECNLYDAITKAKIEQCPDPDEECFNFDYTKTSVNSILTEDYGIMYRLWLIP